MADSLLRFGTLQNTRDQKLHLVWHIWCWKPTSTHTISFITLYKWLLTWTGWHRYYCCCKSYMSYCNKYLWSIAIIWCYSQITKPLSAKTTERNHYQNKNYYSCLKHLYTKEACAANFNNISISISKKTAFWGVLVPQLPAQPALPLASFPEISKALYTSFYQKSHSSYSLLLFPNAWKGIFHLAPREKRGKRVADRQETGNRGSKGQIAFLGLLAFHPPNHIPQLHKGEPSL